MRNITKSVWNTDLTEEQLENTYQSLYRKLILEVDALDNGVSEAKNMKFYIQTGLGKRVGRFNPDWTASGDICQHA